MSSRQWGLLAGVAFGAIALVAGLSGRVVAEGGDRSLTIYNIHTQETVTAVFKRGGRYDPAGLAQLNHIMRDYRRNEEARMDPALADLLWEIHRDLGSREPIHLISGFRSAATNEMLRRTVGGQASQSRHILGKAADVHFPDVSIKQLRYSALIRERGGVGYYPTSAIPFVHVDTDRVRSWPRLPRPELALLFPSGSTRHTPATGGPITPEDVADARARHRELAQQIATFQAQRSKGASFAVAVARPDAVERPVTGRLVNDERPIRPAPPSLVEQPRLASLPPRLAIPVSPSAKDRALLAELAGNATAIPQLVSGPVPAQRPRRPALASMTGSPLAIALGSSWRASEPPQRPERRLAALDPAALASTEPNPTLADTGRFGWGAWISAPAFDEEHPDELSYRPFPIAPFLTEQAQQPLMAELVAHDVARTVEMLDQPDSAATLRFRQTEPVATAMWAQQFTGSAVGIEKLRAAMAATAPVPATGLRSRAVRTTER